MLQFLLTLHQARPATRDREKRSVLTVTLGRAGLRASHQGLHRLPPVWIRRLRSVQGRRQFGKLLAHQLNQGFLRLDGLFRR